MKTATSPRRRTAKATPLSPLLENALLAAVEANERQRVAFTIAGACAHFRGHFPAGEVRQAIHRLNRAGRLNTFIWYEKPCVRLGYREAQARGIRP